MRGPRASAPAPAALPRGCAWLTPPTRAPRSCGAVSVGALRLAGAVVAVDAVWNASSRAATLWLGTDQELVQAQWPQPHMADAGVHSVARRALLRDVDVHAVSYDAAHDMLAVGTNASMWYQNRTLADLPAANSSDSWRSDFVSFRPLGLGAAVAGVPTALAWAPNGTLWIGNRDCLNARLPTLGGPYARIDGAAGLPMNNITSSAAVRYAGLRGPGGDAHVPAGALRADRTLLCSPAPLPLPLPPLPSLLARTAIDVLWLGTERGLVAHDPLDAFPFRYLAGPRYLPDDHVLAVAAVAADDGARPRRRGRGRACSLPAAATTPGRRPQCGPGADSHRLLAPGAERLDAGGQGHPLQRHAATPRPVRPHRRLLAARLWRGDHLPDALHRQRRAVDVSKRGRRVPSLRRDGRQGRIQLLLPPLWRHEGALGGGSDRLDLLCECSLPHESLACLPACVQFLNDVTGSPGFMARSVRRSGDPAASGAWANSTAYPGWLYVCAAPPPFLRASCRSVTRTPRPNASPSQPLAQKRDTSSDEVVGHLFAYSTIAAALGNATGGGVRLHPAAAAAGTGLATAAVRLMDVIGSGLVNNSWYLIDPVTHRRTTWGVWNPAQLNGMRRWADGRGLNSLQILAFMTAARRFTGRSAFYGNATETLMAPANQYGENMVCRGASAHVRHPLDSRPSLLLPHR